MLGGHDDLAGEGEAREGALLEDDDVLRGQTEVVVLLEELDGRPHSARRRHDVPGNLTLERPQLFKLCSELRKFDATIVPVAKMCHTFIVHTLLILSDSLFEEGKSHRNISIFISAT